MSLKRQMNYFSPLCQFKLSMSLNSLCDFFLCFFLSLFLCFFCFVFVFLSASHNEHPNITSFVDCQFAVGTKVEVLGYQSALWDFLKWSVKLINDSVLPDTEDL